MLKMLGLVLISLGWSAAVQAAPVDEMKTACYVGTEPVPAEGSMPQHLEGVITVSPKEATAATKRSSRARLVTGGPVRSPPTGYCPLAAIRFPGSPEFRL